MKVIKLLLVFWALQSISWAAQDVLTYHNDNARTGQNLSETVLNTVNVNVNTFGKLFILPADGKVDAEPLYVSNISVGTGTHNVVFVATEHDSVYAYDADNGALLWSATMLGSGEAPSDDRDCAELIPEIGVTATPVIDRSSGPHGTIYLVAMSKDSIGSYHQRLHALDITTGIEEFGGPVDIQATYPGAGSEGNGTTLTFNPKQHKARASLLLLENIVYVAWASHCDTDPYTAWIMGYEKSTLVQTRLLNITPNGYEGSVWQSGAGLAADSSGNIYFLTANGTADTTLDVHGFPSSGNYGNAFMKLSTARGALAVADYFNMFNTVSESDADQDLGSGGALVLPDMTDSNGVTRHLAIGAGKDQNIYLVDRDNMGQFNSTTNSIYQQFPTPLRGPEFGMAAYFNSAIYLGAVGDNLRMFPFVNARLTDSSSQTLITFGYPGATPSVSANGTANGVVWATENGGLAVLHAYDAANLSTELYNSNQAGGRDHFGVGNKFITPMIANGRVYVGTTDGVGVFGLIAAISLPLAPTSLTFDRQIVGTTSSAQSITLTNLTSTLLTINPITTSGDFGETDHCGSSLAGNTSCTINVTFTPTALGTRNGSLTVTDTAGNIVQSASLIGTGSASGAAVSIAPASLSFANQIVNTTSSAKPVTLTNTGTAALNIISILSTGNFAVSTGDNACGSSLAVGSNCLIYVIFTPAAIGAQRGMLSIDHNAGSSPLLIQLSGTGSAGTVLYLPQIVDGQQLGAIAWTTSIAITNPASTGVASGTITFTQDNAVPFNVSFTDPQGQLVSGNTIPFQLAAGQTNFFTSTAAGPLTAGFATVTSDLPIAVGGIFVETSTTKRTNIAQAGVTAATPLARQAIFAVVTRGADTGLAIANPNAIPADITLQLVDTNGVVAFPAINMTLPPNHHVAEFVSQLFPDAAPSFFGTLQIISQTPVVATALLFQSDGTFTALSVISLASLLNPDTDRTRWYNVPLSDEFLLRPQWVFGELTNVTIWSNTIDVRHGTSHI
jgi:hypothetical protein